MGGFCVEEGGDPASNPTGLAGGREPQGPQNVGGAARVLQNFGLRDLRVVAPPGGITEQQVLRPGSDSPEPTLELPLPHSLPGQSATPIAPLGETVTVARMDGMSKEPRGSL